MLPQFIGNENEIVQKVRANVEEIEGTERDKHQNHYKTVLEKVKPLPFPVLLWKEQHKYLRESLNIDEEKEEEKIYAFPDSENCFKVGEKRAHKGNDTNRSEPEKIARISAPVIDRWIKKNTGSTSDERHEDTRTIVNDTNYRLKRDKKFSKSRQRRSLQREEWFRYQVFYFFQHYKVMQYPLPMHHSLNSLPVESLQSVAIDFMYPKVDGKVIDIPLQEPKEVLAKKYLIGPGDIYAGDYTLYKGVDSPAEGHSVATIRINYETTIPALDLLAFCRVQNKVG